jgi:hypothetical protein
LPPPAEVNILARDQRLVASADPNEQLPTNAQVAERAEGEVVVSDRQRNSLIAPPAGGSWIIEQIVHAHTGGNVCLTQCLGQGLDPSDIYNVVGVTE